MHRLTWISFAVPMLFVVALDPVQAQTAKAPAIYPKSDDPPPQARLRIGTTKFREMAGMTGLAFLPDGKHFVTTKGAKIHYWNLESGAMIHAQDQAPLAAKKGLGFRLSTKFSLARPFQTNSLAPDGKSFAILSDNQIYTVAVDPKNAAEYTAVGKSNPFGGTTKAILAVGHAKIGTEETVAWLTEDGAVNMAPKDDKARFGSRRIDSGISKAHFFMVSQARCAVANREGLVAILDLEKKERLALLNEKNIQSVSLSADGKFLAIRCNKEDLILWDFDKNEKISQLKLGPKLFDALVAPGGKRFAVYNAENKSVELLDTKTREVVLSFPAPLLLGHEMRFSADGKYFALLTGLLSDGGGVIHVWNAENGTSRGGSGHAGAIDGLYWLPTGELLSVSQDASTRIWDAKSGKEKERVSVPRLRTNTVAFSKDGRQLHFASDRDVHVYELENRNQKIALRRDDSESLISIMAMSPDEKTLALATYGIFSEEPIVHIYSLTDGKLAFTMQDKPVKYQSATGHLEFVSDSILLSLSPSGDVRVWDINKKQAVRTFTVGSMESFSYSRQEPRFVISPDRKLFVCADRLPGKPVAGDRILGFWEIDTGNRIKQFTIDKAMLTAITMSRDGKTIITGDAEGAIHVWDVATTNRILHQPAAHRGEVTAIAIAADGRSFATGGIDTSILVWDMPAAKK